MGLTTDILSQGHLNQYSEFQQLEGFGNDCCHDFSHLDYKQASEEVYVYHMLRIRYAIMKTLETFEERSEGASEPVLEFWDDALTRFREVEQDGGILSAFRDYGKAVAKRSSKANVCLKAFKKAFPPGEGKTWSQPWWAQGMHQRNARH